MTDPIPGLTGADHADLLGPNWHEETEEEGNLYGKQPKCNVCLSQLRPVDDPTDTDCRDPNANWESNTCTGFTAVTHETLALRMAELDRLLGIAWDVCMIILDHVGALKGAKP